MSTYVMLSFAILVTTQADPKISLLELPRKTRDEQPSYRIVLDGKKTPMIFDHAMMGERAWARKTKTGLIYGEALADFSGAYSGTRTIAFVKYRGKFISKKEYVVQFGRGDSVIFAPFPGTIFRPLESAYLFRAGKMIDIGKVCEITGWKKNGIEGFYFCKKDGSAVSTLFNFDVDYDVYSQSFVYAGGRRTLAQKKLVYRTPTN